MMRGARRPSRPAQPRNGTQAVLADGPLACDQHRDRTVVDAGRVARCDAAVGLDHRLQLGQRIKGRFARMFILGDRRIALLPGMLTATISSSKTARARR